jgi:hypothetical protein
MTSQMKTLFSQMQDAIDDAVSESGRIDEIVAEMKRCGYDLSLILDFTVTISPTGERKWDSDPTRTVIPEPPLASLGGLRLSDADWKFLKDLNISLA